MPVDRFLGAAWASVHGPSDGGELLLWSLQLGFQGLLPAPAPRPVSWDQAKAQAAELPAGFPALRVAGILDVERRPGAELAVSREG